MIVPDEWLVERLAGSPDDQRVAFRFLDLIEQRGEVLIVRKASRFTTKLQAGLKKVPSGSKRLWMMLWDERKAMLVDDEEIVPLPAPLVAEVPGDDRYLAELMHTKPGAVLVTTDQNLIDILRRNGFEVQHLDEFLA